MVAHPGGHAGGAAHVAPPAPDRRVGGDHTHPEDGWPGIGRSRNRALRPVRSRYEIILKFRYGSLCRSGISPVKVFFDNGLADKRVGGPADASDVLPVRTRKQSRRDGLRPRIERPETLDSPLGGRVCG